MKAILIACIIWSTGFCYAQNYQWTRTIGTTYMQWGGDVCLDNQTNPIMVGYFDHEIDLNPDTIVNLTSSMGNVDIFVSKFDPNGNWYWGKAFGGKLVDRPNSCISDNNNNIYVTGFFEDTVDFNPGGLADFHIAKYRSGFITKYDESGNYLWTKNLSNGYIDKCIALNYNDSSIYLTGTFQDSVDFDPGPGLAWGYAMYPGSLYLLKMDMDGNFIWLKTLNSDSGDFDSNVITMNRSGEILIGGGYQGTVDFDPGIGIYPMTSYSLDAFVLKLDANGNFIWVKGITGAGACQAGGVVTDDNNNVYSTGSYNGGTIDLDPGMGVDTPTTLGYPSAFFQKLDSMGNYVSGFSLTSASGGLASTLAIDADGSLFICGWFEGTVDFNPGPFVYNLTSSNQCVFVMKMDQSANFVTAFQIGDTYQVLPGNIMVHYGEIYLSGRFAGPTDFNPWAGTDIHSSTAPDAFLTKLNESDIGIASIESNQSKIFPNPTTNSVIVDGITETGIFELLNINGEEINRWDVKELKPFVIDMEEYSNGIYFFRFKSGQNNWVKKIIKQ